MLDKNALGVDISTHNGNVDFGALKAAGVEYVIIRCGYGSDYSNQDDDKYERNVQEAIKHNMPWGVYLYSYATNLEMVDSEVKHVTRLLNGRIPPLGVWFDIEDPSQVNLASDLKVNMCARFCDKIEKTGNYAGVYSSLSWWNGPLKSTKLEKYAKWVAQWNNTLDYKGETAIWQFTEKLNIGGKSFDGNRLVTPFDWPVASKPTSHWYDKAVEYVKANGLMVGDSSGFRPNDNITRAEVAQIIYNIMSK